MSDFRKGDFGNAFKSFAVALVTFVIMPMSLFALVDGMMSIAVDRGIEGMDPETFVTMVEMMRQTLERAIKYSIPLLIIAIPMGFYARGNIAKVPFRLMWAFYMAIWLWIIFEGGIITVAIDSMDLGGMTVDAVDMTLDVTFLLYIMLMICITKGFLAFSEYGSYHEEFVEGITKKDKKKAAKQRKREEKTERKAKG